jgi:hypothetical protein
MGILLLSPCLEVKELVELKIFLNILKISTIKIG